MSRQCFACRGSGDETPESRERIKDFGRRWQSEAKWYEDEANRQEAVMSGLPLGVVECRECGVKGPRKTFAIFEVEYVCCDCWERAGRVAGFLPPLEGK